MLNKGYYIPLRHEESKSEHDLEWVSLMKEAKEIGLSPKEVRSFLRGRSRVVRKKLPIFSGERLVPRIQQDI